MIEGHGDDTYRYGGKVKHNFSSNIFSRADHTALMAHLAGCGAMVSVYPEPQPFTLEAEIARKDKVGASCVMVTNGATEAIYLIAMAFSHKKTQIVIPTFREYQDACRMNNLDIQFTGGIDNVSADVVWICNPNNPTGTVTDPGKLMGVASENRATLFVVDQAYADYYPGALITPHEAVVAGNILLLNSLTKRYSIPGLRIGYATGAPDVIEMFRCRRMPWSVNAIGIEAAEWLLRNSERYHIDAKSLHSEALRIRSAFESAGIRSSDTKCNFLLCELPKGTAVQLKEYLVENHGILIRDASNFEGLSARHFRVASQTPEENDLLIKAVTRWLTF